MSNDLITKNIAKLILTIRNTQVIIDSDVAKIYGVQTKDINKAVSNNVDKFPNGYIFELSKYEKIEVVKNFDPLEKLKFSLNLPKAFTEKGWYMLATILKSKKATETTIQIIETFSNIKQLTHNLNSFDENQNKNQQQNLKMEI